VAEEGTDLFGRDVLAMIGSLAAILDDHFALFFLRDRVGRRLGLLAAVVMSAFALMRDSHWAEILILSAWDLCGSRRGCEGIFLFDCHIGSARSREFAWTLLPCEMSRRS